MCNNQISLLLQNVFVWLLMRSGAFFKPGSASLRKAAFPVLEKMGQMLGAPKFGCFNIEVEGHTDDIPIKTKRFPSNWELSAARA